MKKKEQKVMKTANTNIYLHYPNKNTNVNVLSIRAQTVFFEAKQNKNKTYKEHGCSKAER